MSTKINKTLLLIGTFILLVNCQSDYTKLVKSELGKGIKKDSLLYGLSFGDPKQAFFDTCLRLNKKGLVTQGPSNKYAQSILKEKVTNDTTSNIVFLFYTLNDESQVINGMDCKFSYSAWAPWNKELYGYKLLPRVKDTLLNWFPGNSFLKVKLKNNKEVFVKVDGNRQIKVTADENTKDVNVLIEDLSKKYND